MAEGREQDDNYDDRKHLLHHIFLLLDYLERQSDNRLQAQFDDTRHKLSLNSPKMAISPGASYDEFLTKLATVRKSDDASISVEDETFLRWSRDFLAAVAHPATVETICITREYIKLRTAVGLRGWRMWLSWWCGAERPRHGVDNDGFKDTGRFLARSVRWVERLTILATGLALFFSAHAMVGRMIIDQEKDALAKYQELAKAADAARIGLFRVSGAPALVKPQELDRGCPAALAAGDAEATKDGITVHVPANVQPQQAGFTPALSITDPPITAEEAAWSFVMQCRGVQWAQMQLWTENVRLKSWDAFYIKYLKFGIGWDKKTISSVEFLADPKFCQNVAYAYHENSRKNCSDILSLAVRDSNSVANSILGWLTMYILPCLYAFIGAAASAIIGIGRKLNASVLSYADRGWLRQAMILGFVFGGVIGLFANYLSKSPASDGLGLSALALLAGYNVPAVSEMLEDLSKKIFRPGERNGQITKAA